MGWHLYKLYELWAVEIIHNDHIKAENDKANIEIVSSKQTYLFLDFNYNT